MIYTTDCQLTGRLRMAVDVKWLCLLITALAGRSSYNYDCHINWSLVNEEHICLLMFSHSKCI